MVVLTPLDDIDGATRCRLSHYQWMETDPDSHPEVYERPIQGGVIIDKCILYLSPPSPLLYYIIPQNITCNKHDTAVSTDNVTNQAVFELTSADLQSALSFLNLLIPEVRRIATVPLLLHAGAATRSHPEFAGLRARFAKQLGEVRLKGRPRKEPTEQRYRGSTMFTMVPDRFQQEGLNDARSQVAAFAAERMRSKCKDLHICFAISGGGLGVWECELWPLLIWVYKYSRDAGICGAGADGGVAVPLGGGGRDGRAAGARSCRGGHYGGFVFRSLIFSSIMLHSFLFYSPLFIYIYIY